MVSLWGQIGHQYLPIWPRLPQRGCPQVQGAMWGAHTLTNCQLLCIQKQGWGLRHQKQWGPGALLGGVPLSAEGLPDWQEGGTCPPERQRLLTGSSPLVLLIGLQMRMDWGYGKQ